MEHSKRKLEKFSPKFGWELNKMAKEAGIVFFGKIAGGGIKYITQIIIARLVGVQFFGLYALGLVIYQLGELCARMGLERATVRFVSIYYALKDVRKLKGIFLQATIIPLLAGVVVGAVIFIFSEAIAEHIFRNPMLSLIIRIFAISIPLGAAMNVVATSTTGFRVTKYLIYVRELVQPLFYLLFVIILFFSGLNKYGVIWSWVISVGAGLLIAVWGLGRVTSRRVSFRGIKPLYEMRELLSFSLPLVIGDVMLFSLLWTDILILGYFRPPSEVGLFKAASQTVLLLLIFLTSLNTIFGPMIADFKSKDDKERMKWMFRVSTRWSFSLTLPLFLILAVSGREILRFFGPAFVEAWLVLFILACAQLVNAASGGVGVILVMTGSHYAKVIGDIILILVNIAMNILLIPKLGMIGASIATAVSIAGVNILRAIQVYINFNMHAYTMNYLKTAGIAIIALGSGMLVRFLLIDYHFFLSFIFSTLIQISLYFLFFLRFCLEPGDRAVFQSVVKKLRLLSNRYG